ncbi:MAG TPA: hypothetical protein VHT91_08550 [Kofleriaceae bacterium]|nr:hypothetical protein [Kofleriaceae bacterium]
MKLREWNSAPVSVATTPSRPPGQRLKLALVCLYVPASVIHAVLAVAVGLIAAPYSMPILEPPVIRVGGDLARYRQLCAGATVAATVGVPYAMPYERDRPILVCRGLQGGLRGRWPELVHID